MKKEVKKEVKNTLGILGIIIGLFVPIAGFVLGIISITRGEKTAVGVLAIVLSILSWLVAIMILITVGGF
jgi:hypothetical protein